MKKQSLLFSVLSMLLAVVAAVQMAAALFGGQIFESKNRILLSSIEYIPILFLAVAASLISFGFFNVKAGKRAAFVAAFLFLPQVIYHVILLVRFVPSENRTGLYTALSWAQLILNVVLFCLMSALLFSYSLEKARAYRYGLAAFLLFMAANLVVNICLSNAVSLSLWGSVGIFVLQVLVCTPFLLLSRKGTNDDAPSLG